MAVTITRFEQRGPTTWYVEWTGGATSYIYLDGVLASTTTAFSKQFEVAPGETIDITITDDVNEVPAASYPGRALLSWDAVADAVSYLIEEYVDSAWVTRDTVSASSESSHTRQTRLLEDCTSHTFRITPLDASNLAGEEIEATVFMVRRPDQPAVSWHYDSATHTITAHQAPLANFTGTPLSIAAGQSVVFTDSSAPGNSDITTWAWTFGDGQTSALQNPTHIYAGAGTFTVALTATNTEGSNTKTRTNYVTVA